MANSNSGGNQINVPQAKDALNNMKYEIARELGVNLKQGYNGDLTSREAGYVGGYMVKGMYTEERFFFKIRLILSPEFRMTFKFTVFLSIMLTSIFSM